MGDSCRTNKPLQRKVECTTPAEMPSCHGFAVAAIPCAPLVISTRSQFGLSVQASKRDELSHFTPHAHFLLTEAIYFA